MFSQSLEAIASIVPGLDNERLLPNPTIIRLLTGSLLNPAKGVANFGAATVGKFQIAGVGLIDMVAKPNSHDQFACVADAGWLHLRGCSRRQDHVHLGDGFSAPRPVPGGSALTQHTHTYLPFIVGLSRDFPQSLRNVN